MNTWLPILIALLGSAHVMAKLWLWLGIKKALKAERQLSKGPSDSLPALSVVIAARNEASNLAAYLPSILKQSYPQFEVVIALDRCEDNSLEVLHQLMSQYPHLKYCVIDQTANGWAPKKWALSQAIDQAQYDLLVCTDADCWVESDWLLSHGKAFSKGADIVLGLGLYKKYPEALNAFIRYETAHTAFQYMGASGQGNAYMGVGRNMAYKKTLYDKSGGFVQFKESLSGDDDLFVNHLQGGLTSQSLMAKGSRTWSEPKRGIGSFLRQKGRHFSASARYTVLSKIALGGFHLSQIGFYGLLGLFLCTGGHIWVAVGLYIAYLLGCWYIFGLFAREIEETALIATFPLLDFVYACYHGLIAPFGLLAQPSWQKNQNPKYPKTPSRTANS